MIRSPARLAATWASLSGTLLALACSKTPRPPPVWPRDLTQDLSSFTVSRWRGDEPVRSVHVVRGRGGEWRTESPRGEADPDALNELFFTLSQPAILSAKASSSDAGALLSFAIELVKKDGSTRRLEVLRTALGQPVPVRLQGVSDFLVSPIEFSNKIPDPSDFLAASLWATTAGTGATLSVTGRVSYKLKAVGPEEWVSEDGRKGEHDLEDVAGGIVGKAAVSHPQPGPLSRFGLDAPAAVATLCIKAECREFKFGSVEKDGRTVRYAVGPDQDPIELSDPAWLLVVDGPFKRP